MSRKSQEMRLFPSSLYLCTYIQKPLMVNSMNGEKEPGIGNAGQVAPSRIPQSLQLPQIVLCAGEGAKQGDDLSPEIDLRRPACQVARCLAARPGQS